MKTLHYRLAVIISSVLIHCVGGISYAENGVIVESVERSFDEAVLHEMYAENDGLDNPGLRKKMILNTDLKKLEAKAKEIGEPPDVDKYTFYLQGDMFRVDSESPSSGKETMIFRKDLGMMYHIKWSMKQVMKISVDELQQMQSNAQKQIEEMQKNMPPNMEGMLAFLPPDQQDALRKAMGSKGNQSPGQSTEKKKPELTKTGNNRNVNEFSNCVEYRFDEGSEAISMWAYKDKPRVAKMFHEASEKFRDSFGAKNDEVDPHDLLPNDQFPVLTVTYSENMMRGQMELKAEEIVSVKETTIEKKLFEAYNDPSLTESSMMDMMNMGRP